MPRFLQPLVRLCRDHQNRPGENDGFPWDESGIFTYEFIIKHQLNVDTYMDVSKNSGTTKSSILIGFSLINHPFWGTPTFGNIHMDPMG